MFEILYVCNTKIGFEAARYLASYVKDVFVSKKLKIDGIALYRGGDVFINLMRQQK